MRRRVTCGLLLVAALGLVPGVGWTQEGEQPNDRGDPLGPVPDGAFGPADGLDTGDDPEAAAAAAPAAAVTPPPVDVADSVDEDQDELPAGPAAEQEIGAFAGIATGGRVTPGGAALSGTYLYQVDERLWFEGAVGFVFGAGDASCFRDRQDVFRCDHGILDGFSAEVAGGLRYFLASQGRFTPYARGRLGGRLIGYADDEVRGLGLVASAGGGVRAVVSPLVSVVGDAALSTGLGLFDSELGLEPLFGLTITGGVEFRLE